MIGVLGEWFGLIWCYRDAVMFWRFYRITVHQGDDYVFRVNIVTSGIIGSVSAYLLCSLVGSGSGQAGLGNYLLEWLFIGSSIYLRVSFWNV